MDRLHKFHSLCASFNVVSCAQTAFSQQRGLRGGIISERVVQRDQYLALKWLYESKGLPRGRFTSLYNNCNGQLGARLVSPARRLSFWSQTRAVWNLLFMTCTIYFVINLSHSSVSKVKYGNFSHHVRFEVVACPWLAHPQWSCRVERSTLILLYVHKM